MGNEICMGRRSKPTNYFTKIEKTSLNDFYLKLIVDSKNNGSKNLCKNILRNEFLDNSILSDRLYEFMIFLSKTQNEEITFDGFSELASLLIKENPEQNNYRYFDKTEILSIIILKDYTLTTKEHLKTRKIRYEECFLYMKAILKIFICEKKNSLLDEASIKSLLDGLYEQNSGVTTIWNMLIHLKKNLIYLNDILIKYFSTKFKIKSFTLKFPEFEIQSNIMSKENLSLMYLNNIYLQNAVKLKLLFSKFIHGNNFPALVNSIIGYEGPTLVLIKHDEIIEENMTKSIGFGGFSRIMWKNDAIFHGSEESYLFSLYPIFKNFYSLKNNDCEKNYQYLWYNENDQNIASIGLGFGGYDKNVFRIWIDGLDMENKSYCTYQDKTYEPGYLSHPKIENFKVKDIEIWGLGMEGSYNSQLQLRSTGYLTKKETNPDSPLFRSSLRKTKNNNQSYDRILEQNIHISKVY